MDPTFAGRFNGAMNENPASELLASGALLDEIAEAAKGCTACHLYKNATQTVFGDGAKRALVMFVGEQPGDQEDLQGEPFVGPAGRILDRGLEEAGIDRRKVYITNVVKHFKWMPKGKRRIHKKPHSEEINACRPWLEAEIALVKPKIVVCLGATAAQALLGSSFRVTKERGRFVEWDLDPDITATVHPSSILRAKDEQRETEMAAFVKDLKTVSGVLAG
jgi:uracil-DNA glycosylase family protein